MEMKSIDAKAISQLGVVKWFDKERGYGFVTVAEHSCDILLHINTLRDFGAYTAQEGSPIEFEWEITENGTRVSKVLSLAQLEPQLDDCKLNIGQQLHGELEPVKVKWYNPQAGYGFVNRLNDHNDIFVGSCVLREFGFKTLAIDEALAVRICQADGKERVYEVGIW